MREIEVLNLFLARGDGARLTAGEVGEALAGGAGNTWTVLERLRLSGRLGREKRIREDPPRMRYFLYFLTENGKKYATWKKRKH